MPKQYNYKYKNIPMYTRGKRSSYRAVSKLKAAWRGRKERKNFRGTNRGYLTGGRFVRNYY